ncbi:hypothetical protein CK227_10400 [Mesorhizobium sp. WSM4308]|nr:hypothetical protein CK227_10400 [Mesorhizobium sp. WSM4308]
MDCGRAVTAKGLCMAHYLRLRRYGDPSRGGELSVRTRTNPAKISEFIASALESDMRECIIWPFGKSDGYGKFGSTYAHRFICEQKHGPSPSDIHEAAHGCGNASCVNHRHLRWALPKENSADRLVHGTHILGEKCGTSKLTSDDVKEIRRLHGKVTGAELSRRYGVGQMQISRILRRQRWGWLDD